MTSLEREALISKFSGLDVEQMQVAIELFPIEIVFNELERRVKEQIELLAKLDELNVFVNNVTR